MCAMRGLTGWWDTSVFEHLENTDHDGEKLSGERPEEAASRGGTGCRKP